MANEAMVVYESGARRVPMATIHRAADGIEFELPRRPSPLIPYDRRRQEEIVRWLIDLPLRVARDRHRKLPALFGELAPGSDDHFALIQRRVGRFSVTIVEAEA